MNHYHAKEFEIRQSQYERIYNSKSSLCYENSLRLAIWLFNGFFWKCKEGCYTNQKGNSLDLSRDKYFDLDLIDFVSSELIAVIGLTTGNNSSSRNVS